MQELKTQQKLIKRRWPGRWSSIPAPTNRTFSKTSNVLARSDMPQFEWSRSGRRRTARTRIFKAIWQQIITAKRIRFKPKFISSYCKTWHQIPSIRYDYATGAKRGWSGTTMAFCNRLDNTVEQNAQFLDQLIVSDEAIFSLNSEVNTRSVMHPTEMNILQIITLSLLKGPIK